METSGLRASRPFNAPAALQMLVLSLGILAGSVPAVSQANRGRILGSVTDQTGSFIAGAVITIVDAERGVTRSLTTDQAGEYDAPDLIPGTYKVRAESKGFKVVERQNILVGVGHEVRVDVNLEPGLEEQTITVTEQLPLIETTNATLGGSISNETINELPLNGRNYLNLLTLRPGLTIYPGGGSSTQSANGARAEDNSFLLDGVRGDEPFTGAQLLNSAIPAGDAATILPIDSIQEFTTVENPKAEYGWKPGVIVNVGLKSGTNSLHGTAYAFGRDTALDARNFFNHAPGEIEGGPKSTVGLEQFGGTVGGPIKKNKLFFFAGYEGQRYNVDNVIPVTVPVSVAGPGRFTSIIDACNDLNARGVSISTLSAELSGLNAANCTLRPTNFTAGPTENLFPINPGPGTVIIPGLASYNQEDGGLIKGDYHISERHTLSGMYFFARGVGTWNDNYTQLGPPSESIFGPIHAQMGSGNWTWTPSATVVNEFRVGYAHYYEPYFSVDHNVPATAYGLNTGVTDPFLFGMPIVIVRGFGFRLGANWPRVVGPDGSLQLLEHLSVLRGKHALKFGGEFIRNDVNSYTATFGAKGFISFNPNRRRGYTALESFLAGTPTFALFQQGSPQRKLNQELYAGFAQDDWRVTRRLTLNLGVRYELQTVLREANDLIGNFDPAAGPVQVGHGISSPYNGDHNNFAPRVGLAWDILGDGKTVFRAGYSIVYEQLPMVLFIAAGNVFSITKEPTGVPTVVNGVETPPTGTINTNLVTYFGPQVNWNGSAVGGATIFPQGFVCGDGSTAANGDFGQPCNATGVDRNLHKPYLNTWTFGIQRAITNNLSLDLAYVGTHGTKQLGYRDINQAAVGSGFPAGLVAACNTALQPAGMCDPGAADSGLEQAARPFNAKFPYLAYVEMLSNQYKSNYDALQADVTKRLSHGLSFNAGYTWAHMLDDISSNFQGPTPMDSSRPFLQYSSSDFDIRHRFTLALTYALPSRRGFGQLLEGWSVNSVVTLQTGQPWSVRDVHDDFSGTGEVNSLNPYGDTWNFSGNTVDFTSNQFAIPCWSGSGASALTGCTIANQPAACLTAATALGFGAVNTLNSVGCYVRGNSVLIPPGLGTYGYAQRGIFRDSGFRNWDFSLAKETRIKERLSAEFRAEFFNILNHPNLYNPYGASGGTGGNDPSVGSAAAFGFGGFGCGCSTPDQAAPNPVLGSGGARSIQLGLKFKF